MDGTPARLFVLLNNFTSRLYIPHNQILATLPGKTNITHQE
jgi:hypothetical protein